MIESMKDLIRGFTTRFTKRDKHYVIHFMNNTWHFFTVTRVFKSVKGDFTCRVYLLSGQLYHDVIEGIVPIGDEYEEKDIQWYRDFQVEVIQLQEMTEEQLKTDIPITVTSANDFKPY